MPAAIARSPIMMAKPAKLRLNTAISPDRMSQIANNKKPIFFVMCKVVLLS
jgi:hypothetical protein